MHLQVQGQQQGQQSARGVVAMMSSPVYSDATVQLPVQCAERAFMMTGQAKALVHSGSAGHASGPIQLFGGTFREVQVAGRARSGVLRH